MTMPYSRWRTWRACTRKRRYDSRSLALSTAWRVALFRDLLAPEARPVPCDLCGGWHLTSRWSPW